MKKICTPFSLIFLCALFVAGCDLAQPQNKGQRQPAGADLALLDLGAVEPAAPQEPQHAQNQQGQNEDDTVLVRAQTGVGAQGSSLARPTAGNAAEIVTAPVYAMFRTQQRVIFQQIEHAKNLFQGEHGRLPNSHEEYMQEIIQKNNIQLPRLPDGQEYVYDPAAGELNVRRPR